MALLSTLKLKPPKALAAKSIAAKAVPSIGPGPGPAAGAGPAGAAPKADKKAETSATKGIQVGKGDISLSVKEADGGATVVLQWEKKQNVGRQNFKVWVIPCYIKADLKAAIEGEVTIGNEKGGKVHVKGAGALELGIGATTEKVTAGPYGSAELSAAHGIQVVYSETAGLSIDAFAYNVYATGKVGVKFEIENSWMANAEAELVNWHLFVVHIAGYANGKFSGIRVEPGKDMQRLIAALQQAGPQIEAAVEKYAPEAVKKAAVDAAKWSAESKTAGKIADVTDKGLKKLEKETGVDVGGGVQSIVRDLVDPGGETAKEATERFKREAEAFNASNGEFVDVMEASGLRSGALRPFRSSAEYNAIVEAWRAEAEIVSKGGQPSGQWRKMAEALVVTARQRQQAKAAADAAAKQKAADDAAADLARRVKEADARMNAAWQSAVGPGNTINNSPKAAEGTAARKYWQTGMLKYYNKGVQAKQQVASLQGEARILKADEATALFANAAKVFREGVARLG